ncbi:MAG: HIT domain-containing protein [Vicinamibacterales bacterium]
MSEIAWRRSGAVDLPAPLLLATWRGFEPALRTAAESHRAIGFTRETVPLLLLSFRLRNLRHTGKTFSNVGHMIESGFNPCHTNYMRLGNVTPHLHMHVVPRYLDDTAPERPLPWGTD